MEQHHKYDIFRHDRIHRGILNDKKMKYYFIANINKVFEREDVVDTRIFKQWTELTTDQVAYYLAHPDASRADIECLGIHPEVAAPALADYKASRLSELRELQGNLLGAQISPKDAIFALLGVYGTIDSAAKLVKYKALAVKFNAEYLRIAALITVATTNAAVMPLLMIINSQRI